MLDSLRFDLERLQEEFGLKLIEDYDESIAVASALIRGYKYEN